MQKMILTGNSLNCGTGRWLVGVRTTAQPQSVSPTPQIWAGMQKMIFIGFVFLISLESCNPNGTVHLTDPVEAGREFIDASLKGNYNVAKKYVLADSLNMEMWKEIYFE